MISTEHIILIIIGSFVLLGIIAYACFLIFLPEWVGVTGRVARKAQRDHVEGTEVKGEDIISKWHQPSKVRESTDLQRGNENREIGKQKK